MLVPTAPVPPERPRTRATAKAEPRNGSSPAPSTTRPQRASRAMSTIGAKSQSIPCAVASSAATRAQRSARATSQLAASARGTGKMVRKPWMTSDPKSSGTCRRVSSTAMRCKRRVVSAPRTPRNEPTRPLRISSTVPVEACGPVSDPSPPTWVSWPSFSSSVMRERSASTRGLVALAWAPAGDGEHSQEKRTSEASHDLIAAEYWIPRPP